MHIVTQTTGESFRAVGLMVREHNWLSVYPYTNWGGHELPVFHEGQTFLPSELSLKQVRGHRIDASDQDLSRYERFISFSA